MFTAYTDTAEYLYNHLREYAAKRGMRAAMVSGSECKSDDETKYQNILNAFSPLARNHKFSPGKKPCDLLIATDCVSEGQNLQDCDVVLNYDIHWNPVRLIQRFGRIYRLGSKNKEVNMINYWPMDDIDNYLKLTTRVEARWELAKAAGGESDFQSDLRLKQIWRDKAGFDAMNDTDSVDMSDLTLGYFISQLLHYIEKYRNKLEEIPHGAYAVANAKDAADAKRNILAAKPGAIFCFQDTTESHQTLTSFYLVYAGPNGVFHGNLDKRKTLQLFESLTLGKTKPLSDLPDVFFEKIKDSEGKKPYDNMLRHAIASICEEFEITSDEQLQERGGQLPSDSETPSSEKLKLITWLVIENPEETSTLQKRGIKLTQRVRKPKKRKTRSLGLDKKS